MVYLIHNDAGDCNIEFGDQYFEYSLDHIHLYQYHPAYIVIQYIKISLNLQYLMEVLELLELRLVLMIRNIVSNNNKVYLLRLLK